MVVYLAFDRRNEGPWRTFSLTDIAVVIVADIVLLAIVLCATTFGSRPSSLQRGRPDHHHPLLEEEPGERRSMATVIFVGQPIGAIVLPLMLTRSS